MKKLLPVSMLSQPDYTSCGPTSLHAIYLHWKDEITFEQLLQEIPQFDEGGGTLAVVLGIHALKRGYSVTIYNYNINIFDPSWFSLKTELVIEKLKLRMETRVEGSKDIVAIKHYIEYLRLGGHLKFDDLTARLIKSYLKRDIPVLTGLSSTWLYQSIREHPISNEYDDVHGEPAGHFVVLHGADIKNKLVYVADPYRPNPISGTNYYQVHFDKLINAILLGVTSYDGNLLIIEKKSKKRHEE